MSLRVAAAAFREGYRLARLEPDDRLVEAVQALGHDRAPFAVEGAAMARCLHASDGRREDRLAVLLEWSGGGWTPFVRLGEGCAVARLGEPPPEHPLTLDGFGFQLVLTAGVSGHRLGSGNTPRERGQGRALWFVMDGDARACARRLADVVDPGGLWRGLGTACTFAGDPHGHAGLLAASARMHGSDLARGAREALALWRSLGAVPPRAAEAARRLGTQPS